VLALPKPQARARAIVDIADLRPLLLGACLDSRERALLVCAMDTGARRGELLGLMPEDVVTIADPWRLRFQRQRPKPNAWSTTPLKVNGGNRSLPVTQAMRAALAELLALGAPLIWQGRGRQTPLRSPFLFPYRVHDLNHLRDRLRAVAPSAFPPGDFLHALRHTLSFELNRSGASDEDVQKQLGHTSTQSTRDVYINLHARAVDLGPMQRLEAARRIGVTSWGPAPPGRSLEKRTAGASTPAVQECSARSRPTITKENTTCSTPSLKRPKIQRALPGLSVGPVVKRPKR
jgi:integrase